MAPVSSLRACIAALATAFSEGSVNTPLMEARLLWAFSEIEKTVKSTIFEDAGMLLVSLRTLFGGIHNPNVLVQRRNKGLFLGWLVGDRDRLHLESFAHHIAR